MRENEKYYVYRKTNHYCKMAGDETAHYRWLLVHQQLDDVPIHFGLSYDPMHRVLLVVVDTIKAQVLRNIDKTNSHT